MTKVAKELKLSQPKTSSSRWLSSLVKSEECNYVAFKDAKEWNEILIDAAGSGFMVRSYFSDEDQGTTNWTGIVEFWK